LVYGSRKIVCPDCGEILVPDGNGKYVCDNKRCPVIFVWPEHGYLGSNKVVRDAAMANDRRAQDISRVATRLEG